MDRLTLCNFLVDETTAEQRADHALREAAFCGRCTTRARNVTRETETVFTASGGRRHLAVKAGA